MSSSPEPAKNDNKADNDLARIAKRVNDQIDEGHLSNGYIALQTEYTNWMQEHKWQNQQSFWKAMDTQIGEKKLQDLSLVWGDDIEHRYWGLGEAVGQSERLTGNSLTDRANHQYLTPNAVKLLREQKLQVPFYLVANPPTNEYRLDRLETDHRVSDLGPDGNATTELILSRLEERMLPAGFDVTGQDVDTRLGRLWSMETHPDYLGAEMSSHLLQFLETDKRAHHSDSKGDPDSPGVYLGFFSGFNHQVHYDDPILSEDNIANERQAQLHMCSTTDAGQGEDVDSPLEDSVKQIKDEMAKGHANEAVDTLGQSYRDWHDSHPQTGSNVFWQFMESKDGIGERKMDQLSEAWADQEPNFELLAHDSDPANTNRVGRTGTWNFSQDGNNFDNKMAARLYRQFSYEPFMYHSGVGRDWYMTPISQTWPFSKIKPPSGDREDPKHYFDKPDLDARVAEINQQNIADEKERQASCGE